MSKKIEINDKTTIALDLKWTLIIVGGLVSGIYWLYTDLKNDIKTKHESFIEKRFDPLEKDVRNIDKNVVVIMDRTSPVISGSLPDSPNERPR